MATLKFKIRNGIPPYIAKLKQVSVVGNGYYGYNIYEGLTVFTQQRVEVNGTEVQFTSVPTGSYVLEVVDDTKFSTIDFINVP
jgi:hypothetical protein